MVLPAARGGTTASGALGSALCLRIPTPRMIIMGMARTGVRMQNMPGSAAIVSLGQGEDPAGKLTKTPSPVVGGLLLCSEK